MTEKNDNLKTPAEEMTNEEAAAKLLHAMQEIMSTGGVLKSINGISDDEMEAVYAMGFNFYRSGNLENAEKIFKFLCLFDHLNQKYWIGMGAVQQVKKDFKSAITSYGYAAMLDITNPKPPMYCSECYLAIGDYTNALSALESLEMFCPDDTEQNKKFRKKAAALKAIVNAKIACEKK